MKTPFGTEKTMRGKKCWLAIAAAAFALMMPEKPASSDPGNVPPGQIPTFTAEWWQWAYSFSNSQSPLNDPTGERCMFGQHGPLWFLAGNQNANEPRSCSVPEGATLLFPIINTSNFFVKNECGNGPDKPTLKELRKEVAAFIDPVDPRPLFADIDNNSIKNLIQRVQSVAFPVALPDDNLCDFPGSFVAPGIYSPTVDDGYYILLRPLPPGQYTLRFGSTDQHFLQDNTYNLTVVAVSLK
jgi:hypothetical protein